VIYRSECWYRYQAIIQRRGIDGSAVRTENSCCGARIMIGSPHAGAHVTAHIAYCVPLLKIADFLAAGVHVKILLADVSRS
jgi:hypothetical protein